MNKSIGNNPCLLEKGLIVHRICATNNIAQTILTDEMFRLAIFLSFVRVNKVGIEIGKARNKTSSEGPDKNN